MGFLILFTLFLTGFLVTSLIQELAIKAANYILTRMGVEVESSKSLLTVLLGKIAKFMWTVAQSLIGALILLGLSSLF